MSSDLAQMVRGVEVEPSSEHGESPERDAFLFDEELMAPVECRRERLLAVEMTTLARGEYRQARR